MKHASKSAMRYAKDILEIIFYALGIIVAVHVLLS